MADPIALENFFRLMKILNLCRSSRFTAQTSNNDLARVCRPYSMGLLYIGRRLHKTRLFLVYLVKNGGIICFRKTFYGYLYHVPFINHVSMLGCFILCSDVPKVKNSSLFYGAAIHWQKTA